MALQLPAGNIDRIMRGYAGNDYRRTLQPTETLRKASYRVEIRLDICVAKGYAAGYFDAVRVYTGSSSGRSCEPDLAVDYTGVEADKPSPRSDPDIALDNCVDHPQIRICVQKGEICNVVWGRARAAELRFGLPAR